MQKKDIKNLTLEELEKLIEKAGEKPYRAKQVFYWLYQKCARTFEEMSNIPKALKNVFSEEYYIGAIELCEHQKSKDKTEKFLFKLSDGNFIETVLIWATDRKTICLSTQVGCKFGCPFCASGLKGFVRNLAASEIIGQIMYLKRDLKHLMTNYVFMGMGEPLDNYENVSKSILIMDDTAGMNIGARRITVSTSGLVPGIEKLKNLGLQVNLSVSLHASNDKLRDELVPVNRRYPIETLIKACEEYRSDGGRMITFEYILISGKNDSLKDADELARIAKKVKAKINLIPYSPVSSLDFKTPTRDKMNIFMDRLEARGVQATLRDSKGKDIQAACGQLAGRQK